MRGVLRAIFGDNVGSIYEASPIKITDFPLFAEGATITNDTICKLSILQAVYRRRAAERRLCRPPADLGALLAAHWERRQIPHMGFPGWQRCTQEPLTYDATVMSEILTDTDPVWGRGTALILARDDPAEITTAINTSSAQRAFGPGAVINDFDGILVMAPTMRHFALGASEYPVIATFFGGLPDAPQGPWRPASVHCPACVIAGWVRF
jgi:hypothetical protein